MKVKRIKVGFTAVAMVVAVGALGGGAMYSGYLMNTGQNRSEEVSAYQVSADLSRAEIKLRKLHMYQAFSMDINISDNGYTFSNSIENKNIFAGAIKAYIMDNTIRQAVPVTISSDWINIDGSSISLNNTTVLNHISQYPNSGEMYLSYKPDVDLSGLTVVHGGDHFGVTVSNPVVANIEIRGGSNTEVIGGSNGRGSSDQIVIAPYKVESRRREVDRGAILDVNDSIGEKSDDVVVAWKEKPDTNTYGDKIGRIGYSVKSGLTVVGEVKVNVSVKDNTPPVFNTTAPSKIIIRRYGVANLNDVTASDPESGLREITNDAQLQGVNSAMNSQSGTFTVTYTAINNSGVSATLRREVEIVDDSNLKNKITEAENFQNLNRATQQTRQALMDKVTESNRVIDNEQTPQADIDRLVQELTRLMQGIRFDKTALQNVVDSVTNEKQAIKDDVNVIAKLRAANNILNKDTASVQEIDSAQTELEEALRNARSRVAREEEEARRRQEELNRQNNAREAVRRARENLENDSINDAKRKVALIQDANTRIELNSKIQEIEDLNIKRNELLGAIRRGEGVDTQGMTTGSKNTLASEINQGKQKLADKTTNIDEITRRIQAINDAINGLKVDKTALQNLVNSVPNEKQAVRQDAEVVRALNNANAILGKNNATPQEIDSAKQQLEDALRNARNRVAAQEEAERQRQAEVARQNDARRAVEHARQTLDGGDVNTAKQKVALIQDDTVKNELNGKIREIEELIAKRNELENAIRRGEQADVNGKTQTSRDALTGAINQGKQKLADKTTNIDEITRRIQAINDAINGLKVDKTALKESIRGAENQPDHIKEAIRNELNNAKAVDGNNGATVNDVATAKNSLDVAIRNAINDENNRQTEARNTLNSAKNTISSAGINSAQDKINRVQDLATRQNLQNELDSVKNQLRDKKNELRRVIEESKGISVDGKTADTIEALNRQINLGEQTHGKNETSKEEIDSIIRKIRESIDGLRTDKKPLQDEILDMENQPDFIKNDKTVQDRLREINDINRKNNPSVEEVRRGIENLKNSIRSATDAENNRQGEAGRLLNESDEEIKNNTPKKDELPVIDIEKIQGSINEIKDLDVRGNLQARLDNIKKFIENKTLQIEEDKRVEAEKKLQEALEKRRHEEMARREAEEKRRQEIEAENAKKLGTPNTGHNKDNHTDNVIIAFIAGATTFLLGGTIAFRKIEK